ncbi:hypothetical protein SAMN06272765_0606 [Streptomyces sp. Ag109_G2-15]|nr:hypothetical protein SAMN06272765_0606 [Streptomyces sp. Ag109_G2-15]
MVAATGVTVPPSVRCGEPAVERGRRPVGADRAVAAALAAEGSRPEAGGRPAVPSNPTHTTTSSPHRTEVRALASASAAPGADPGLQPTASGGINGCEKGKALTLRLLQFDQGVRQRARGGARGRPGPGARPAPNSNPHSACPVARSILCTPMLLESTVTASHHNGLERARRSRPTQVSAIRCHDTSCRERMLMEFRPIQRASEFQQPVIADGIEAVCRRGFERTRRCSPRPGKLH